MGRPSRITGRHAVIPAAGLVLDRRAEQTATESPDSKPAQGQATQSTSRSPYHLRQGKSCQQESGEMVASDQAAYEIRCDYIPTPRMLGAGHFLKNMIESLCHHTVIRCSFSHCNTLTVSPW